MDIKEKDTFEKHHGAIFYEMQDHEIEVLMLR